MDERQTRAFELHLQGNGYRQIAALLNISLETAVADVRFEGERRAVDMAKDRTMNIASALGRLQGVVNRSLVRERALMEAAFETTYDIDPQTQRQTIRRELKNPKAVLLATMQESEIVKAQKEIDKIVGLHWRLPEGELPPAGASPTAITIFMLEGMDPEQRIRKLREMSAEAQRLGVAPLALPK